MKNIILILFILFSAFFATAQFDHPRETTRVHFKKIEVYGKKYNNSIHGINSFLKDLKKKDINLHQEMYSKYRNYKKRQLQGNLLIGGGIFIGGGLMTVGGLLIQASSSEEKSSSGNLLILGGLGIVVAGIGFGATRKIKTRRFIFDFTNEFNKISEVEKMRYTVTPKVGFGNNIYGGLNLNIWF